ncbi:hypothetical protein KSP39_PZI008167 [Platanthera zijinensis]|uniref:Uncharacterized protein n=1 Tax=Platanthera zijinensis TaxID=2320716 RepID=A0AAP0G8H7_9ASPA
MADPFEAIIPECTIPPDVEIDLFRAPEIGESFFCSVICTPNDRSSGAVSIPNTPPEIERLADSPPNPPAEDHLRDIPTPKESSSFPPPGISRVDFAALINFLSQNSDRSLGNHDILDIAERKGLTFPPPKWWRPGGYK